MGIIRQVREGSKHRRTETRQNTNNWRTGGSSGADINPDKNNRVSAPQTDQLCSVGWFRDKLRVCQA